KNSILSHLYYLRKNNVFLYLGVVKRLKLMGMGYEQLIENYYPNRFRDLEYKFTNEEIREETDESFRYHAVAYVTGIENGKRSEMKLNYDMKIVKVNSIFMVLDQKQYVQ
ncbi:hypothetical protein ACQKFK_21415, partial [Bacillus mycoides]